MSTGCAFTNANLKVGYDENHATRGPISSMGRIEFQIDPLTDSREDQGRIGYKRNGFGAHTADITTEQPVATIVAEALQASIKHNGHIFTESGDITIRGDVTQFWFDLDINFWTVRFMGTVEATLEFVDNATQTTIYQSDYQGYYEKVAAGGLEKTWTEVMQLALENMIDSIIKDPQLAKSLREKKSEHQDRVGSFTSQSAPVN